MGKMIGKMASACVAAVFAAMLLGACSTAKLPPQASLYDRLGGLPVLTELIGKSVDRHAADPRTRRSFEGVDLKKLKASIVTQACEATGGPCKYQGKSMPKAHEGLDITPAEFDVAMGHIGQTMDELHIGEREKREFLALLAPMKKDIVDR